MATAATKIAQGHAGITGARLIALTYQIAVAANYTWTDGTQPRTNEYQRELVNGCVTACRRMAKLERVEPHLYKQIFFWMNQLPASFEDERQSLITMLRDMAQAEMQAAYPRPGNLPDGIHTLVHKAELGVDMLGTKGSPGFYQQNRKDLRLPLTDVLRNYTSLRLQLV